MKEGRSIEDAQDREFSLIKQRLHFGKRDMAPIKKEYHVCSFEVCNPQNEADLIRQGSLQGYPVSSNVYVCRYGTIHICSRTECTYVDGTCPVSGFQWGTRAVSYDKNDSRTWKDQEVIIRKKPKLQHQMSESAARECAIELISRLLYSSARQKVNQAALTKFQREAEKARQTYIQSRLETRQLPYLTELYRLNAYIFSAPLPAIEYERDDYRIKYYVGIIMQMWAVVRKHYVPRNGRKFDPETGVEIPPKIDFAVLCVGVLYAMRDGISSNNRIILPKDSFLAAALPDANHLVYFSIPQPDLTKGMAYLSRSFQAALQANVSFDEICVDVSKLLHRDEHVPLVKLGGGK